MQMTQKENKTDEGAEKNVQENPVLIWEQTVKPQQAAGDKVVDLNAYRQLLKQNESEATVTYWELSAKPSEQPVKLIMVSSGFGKSHQGTNSIQCMAA
jgi:hypothetical protein